MRRLIKIEILALPPLELKLRASCSAHPASWSVYGGPELVFATIRQHVLEDVAKLAERHSVPQPDL